MGADLEEAEQSFCIREIRVIRGFNSCRPGHILAGFNTISFGREANSAVATRRGQPALPGRSPGPAQVGRDLQRRFSLEIPQHKPTVEGAWGAFGLMGVLSEQLQ